METRPILVVLGLLAATAVLAEAYKWVDDDGVVHYSDRPQPGAERIELATDSPPTASSARRQANAPSANQSELQPLESQAFRYESLTIASPGAEETLWNIGGVLSVSVALSPALQGTHQVRVYLDGGGPQTVSGQTFVLDDVYRGVHNIQVEVVDQTGKLMIRSRPNRFYVQQNVINQNRP